MINKLLVVVLAALTLAGTAYAIDEPGRHDKDQISKNFKKSSYSPYAGRDFATQVYFGDTHLHTALSGDAFGFGNKLDDEVALRFARGEEVTSAGGLQVKLSRPLDFLVVADHAEAYGSMIAVHAGKPELMGDPTVKRWNEMLHAGGDESFKAVMEMIDGVAANSLPPVLLDKKFIRSIWEKHTEVVDQYNEVGKFTAFQGYEWSSHPGGNNLHRVVMFRDAADKVKRIVPFSAFDSTNPEHLWQWMEGYEEKTGGSILAIPHNGNLSSGTMFDDQTVKGKRLSKPMLNHACVGSPFMRLLRSKVTEKRIHYFLRMTSLPIMKPGTKAI